MPQRIFIIEFATADAARRLGRIGPPIAATRIGNRVVLARAMALGPASLKPPMPLRLPPR
jgi:hypothetical protein